MKKLIRRGKFWTTKQINEAYYILFPYLIKFKYLNGLSQEIQTKIGGRLGEVLALVLELDDAYRYRLYDLLINLPKDYELKDVIKALQICNKRDKKEVYKKYKWFYLLLLITVKIEWRPKEDDIYWMWLKGGYNFFGLDTATRYKLYKSSGRKIPNITYNLTKDLKGI